MARDECSFGKIIDFLKIAKILPGGLGWKIHLRGNGLKFEII